MNTLKITILFVFLFLSSHLFAQKHPYPKYQKLYDKGKFEQCLTELSKQIGKNNNSHKKFWLYCLEMRCHNALYEKTSKLIQLKKANNSGKKMMYKYSENLPEYAQIVITEYRNSLRIVSNQGIEADNIIEPIYSKLFSTFNTYGCAWDAYHFYKKRGSIAAANDILNKAIQKNYTARKTGDTINFYYAFEYEIESKLEDGNLYSAKKIFDLGIEVYEPGLFCNNISNYLIKYMDNISVYYPTQRENITNWLDKLTTIGCETKGAKIAFYLAVYNTFSTLYNEPEVALDAAMILWKMDSITYNRDLFYSQFINNTSILFEFKDSVLLETVFLISQSNNNAKIEICKKAIKDLCLNNAFIKANSLVGYIKRHFPNEKKAIANGLLEIKNQLEITLKNGASISRKSILSFYGLNPKNQENKNRFVELTKRFIAANILLKNHGECFRMLKVALNYYPGDITLLKLKKDFAISDYQENYLSLKNKLSAELVNLDVANCKPGNVTPESQKKFISVLNYCRRLAGLYDSCVLSEELNKKAQKAALIMTANNYLTHAPATEAKCYTADGAQAAGASNLSLGHNGIYALLGQLDDNGSNNGSVGHRRWILNPSTNVFGHGSGQNTMALYVFGHSNATKNTDAQTIFDKATEFVAWPAPDYFPKSLVPDRWSFGFGGAIFDSCEIIVKQNNKKIKVQKETMGGPYGLPTIVWNMEEYDRSIPLNIEIRNVSITKKGKPNGREMKTFTYQVSLF